uniref:Peptidase S1 domain-containing protein n=1 Tax=Scylla olivacea TaxID=85551 RepID=A0A0N7ZDN3_SCYOL
MIRPICLPEPDFDVRADGTATVTSWDFPRSSVLRKARLDSVDVDHCSISPRGIILDGQICFRTQDDILCGGDSGSPVVMPVLTSSKFIQVGMFSHVQHPLCLKHLPVVFTSVVKYRDWIEQILKQH